MLNLLLNHRWMRSLRYAFVLVAIATLAACGGGGAEQAHLEPQQVAWLLFLLQVQ
ncbi:MAG: hypothetical protein WAO71_09860 [Gallionella sp.]